MDTTIARTRAEEALARHFETAASVLPGAGRVAEARRRAMHAIESAGLPHRRLEAWKYTDLRAKLKTVFAPASGTALRTDDAVLADLLGRTLDALACVRLVFVNGRLVRTFGLEGAGEGRDVRISSLEAVLGATSSDWLERGFGSERLSDDPIMALNVAFAADGAVIDIADGARLERPIHIVSIADTSAPVALATRHLIRFGAASRAVILESHVEAGGGASQATAATLLDVGEGAEAHHLKHVAIAGSSVHLGRIDVKVSKGALCRCFQLTAGAGLLRNESRVSFVGPDARLDLSGAMLGRGDDHIDTTLVVDHATPGCESRELFKAVLDDRARAVFQGKVIVQPDAQKTDGKQMAQALMLSPEVEFDSKPELEIYADDVACGHGSTAAELDPALLFYLRSRGIPLSEARAMLIESFVGEALDKVEDAALRQALMDVATAWLGQQPSAKR